VIKSVKIEEISLDLFPMEKDVLTIEDDLSFRNLMLGYDAMILSTVLKSIEKIQALYGQIPIKYAKGNWSSFIVDRLTSTQEENRTLEREQIPPEIDMLILLDRSIDIITPLCTQVYLVLYQIDVDDI
jgi:vacuolar protein sorting-associated protein 33A